MRAGLCSSLLALTVLLAGCGGGDGSSSTSGATAGTPTPSPTSTPTPTPASTACTLASRQQWALTKLQEWYLFPDLLDTTVDPASYGTVQDYIDALVAPARAQSKDRYFTYLTSISEENAYYQQGATAGFGVRLGFDYSSNRLFVIEAYENAPGLAAGLDRGTEIIGIGTTTSNIQSISTLVANGGTQAVSDALGPSTTGTTRVLQIRQLNSSISTVSVTKKTYSLLPVSSRYGVKVIDDNGAKVGYVNLRTFVDTADPALRDAFSQFRAQGITKVIVDLRYNGGGLVSIAELFSNLLNGQRNGEVMGYTTFSDSKSNNNETTYFSAQPEAIGATRVAFIGTGSTASASEFVMNAEKPYLGANAALIGTNTYGKPVGQVGLDMADCDDRLRAIAFRIENANHEGDYYTGLGSHMDATCQASDDISYQLGDPQEASIKVALDYLDGRSCTAIQSTGLAAQSVGRRALLNAAPNTAQKELPGLY
ncbi:S41 family peptidase [Novosphingobium mangrovi (ex Huang et al. 2023)]|uniref:S41 family peptidase n=1 Tax=Novosphingobium mangrovi (ex Huang et al. 2023) TaxID=2976432 RepID=A0ABT2I4P2_9SPHN|nr:S41 family peptidase [Novosphingobium mangrovi (ex Huang et al. 2023)]MCT2399773.1 S41 family peptidase [Novosphingobium mangrovi (ex Huang et al. 2023)]